VYTLHEAQVHAQQEMRALFKSQGRSRCFTIGVIQAYNTIYLAAGLYSRYLGAEFGDEKDQALEMFLNYEW